MNRSAAKFSVKNTVVAIALLAFALAFVDEARGVPCAGVAEKASDVAVTPAAGWLLPEAAPIRSLGARVGSPFGKSVASDFELGPFLIRTERIANNDDRYPSTMKTELLAIEGEPTWSPDLLSWVDYTDASSAFSLRNDARDGVVVLMARNVGADGAYPFRIHYHAGRHRFGDLNRFGISAACILFMLVNLISAKRRLRLLAWPTGEVDASGNIIEADGSLIAAADLRARFPAETAVLYHVQETAGSYRTSQAPRVVDVVRGNHNDVKLSAAKLDSFAMSFAVGAIVSAISLCWR
jgi:hypothetical protein